MNLYLDFVLFIFFFFGIGDALYQWPGSPFTMLPENFQFALRMVVGRVSEIDKTASGQTTNPYAGKPDEPSTH